MEQHGYAGKILRVDLSSGEITSMRTIDYADRFIGGNGIAAKIYWDEVLPEVGPFDPENRLMFMTGPLAGFPGLGGSKWSVCGKSPVTIPEQFCHGVFGGSWGAQLKAAGYDGIVIQGKSDKPVYLFVQDEIAEVRDASYLWGKGAIEVREALKKDLGSSVKVVACGPAGENGVLFATLLADEDSTGAGGFGAVMGSKKLKAIAVRGSRKATAANPGNLRQYTEYIREATRGQLLLVLDHESPEGFEHPYVLSNPHPKMKKQVCYGCGGYGCDRATYEAADGTKGKYMCAASTLYRRHAYNYYGQWDWEVPFHAVKLCDNYGLDAMMLLGLLEWLSSCNTAGLLTEESTGLPLSKMGSLEFIHTLLRMISCREGFGEILAQGITRAAEEVSGSKELISEFFVKQEGAGTDPRLFSPVALLFAMEPRLPRDQYDEIWKPLNGWLHWVKHEKHPHAYISSDVWRAIAKSFLGSEIAADFSTYEGKALAAKIVQDREAVNRSLILCLYIWPIMATKNPENHVGDPALESKVFSAVTGKMVDEEGFRRMGEAIYNLERAIRVREGHRGRESDILPEFYFTSPIVTNFTNSECLVPGKSGEVISKKGSVLDRKAFERMKDEYYQLRGWDVATGLQTRTKLEELGLAEVARDLGKRGHVV